MKRIIKFIENDVDYQFVDDGECILSINKNDMQFDVKKFYIAFFSEDAEYKSIQIENTLVGNKSATRVYECINKLFNEIVEKLDVEQKDNKSNINV